MTRQQLFKTFIKLQQEELELVKKKNADYSSEDNPFANFDMFGAYGFLVRMSDKLMRVKQILEHGEIKVKDESVKDTLMDLSNYANLLIAYLNDNNKKK